MGRSVTRATWALLPALLSSTSWGQTPPASPDTNAAPVNSVAEKEKKPYTFSIKPVVIDSANSSGAALGLDYDFAGKYQFWTTRTGAGSKIVELDDLDKTFRAGQLDLRARGTLASSKEKNPNKLLDFIGSGVLKLNAPSYWVKLGGTLTFETDQSFDNKQRMFGVTGTVSKVGSFLPGDAGSVIVNYGKVKPTKDEERKKVTGNLNSFRRWDLELSYSIPVNQQRVRSIDFDYRHYQEVSASNPIKVAGLDRNRLGLIRVNLEQNFFVQYSKGSLPFDQKSERAVKIGWSADFE